MAPRKLLNTQKASLKKSLTEIYQENADNSPFLQLPAELRNRIYVYALGDRTIHVIRQGRGSGREYGYSICRNDQEVAVGTLRNVGHGKACEPKGDLPFALLRCSRQIYEEAALIPYATNTFHTKADGLDSFFATLMPVQAKAIKAVVISDQLIAGDSYHFVGHQILSNLTGLQDFSMGVYPCGLRKYQAHEKSSHERLVGTWKWVELGHFPSVKVRYVGNERDDPSILKKWATEVEETAFRGRDAIIQEIAKTREEEATARANARQAQGLRSLN